MTFYEDEGFEGRSITLNGPAQFSKLNHLPGDSDYDWGDKFGSLRTGPDAWVTLFNDENFGDDRYTFGPGSNVRKLPNDDDTDSLKIFDRNPEGGRQEGPKVDGGDNSESLPKVININITIS